MRAKLRAEGLSPSARRPGGLLLHPPVMHVLALLVPCGRVLVRGAIVGGLCLSVPALLSARSGGEAPSARIATPSDEEIVKEFKRYFRQYKDTATRVEAVLALEGADTPSVVQALVPVLKNKDAAVVDAAVRVLASLADEKAVAELFVQLAEERKEETRIGLLRAIRDGGHTGDREVLLELLEESSWELRRRAIQALALKPDPELAAALVPLCEDSEVAVRCAALDGLANMKSELVLAPARVALADEAWQVRASAIGALALVRDRDSIDPLLARMEIEEGRLVRDIGLALAALTGRDFGERIDGWKRFWDLYRERFVLPTDEELARLREKQKEREAEYRPGEGTSFHGVETPSRSILFVIDVSGSMEQEVVERQNFADGNYPSFKRMDIVKTELARTIEALEPYVRFNILAFATEVDRWKKDLVTANVLNKSSAKTWVGRLEAIGGSSKEELAAVGLTGAANLEAGKTNTFGALEAALRIAQGGKEDKDYEVDVDTIFFLSDGRPSHGLLIEPEDILHAVRESNALRKVVIHSIALGEFQKDFMRRLAEENGGVFVDLGR